MIVNGTYEEGVRDTLKFLSDNGKVEIIEMPEEQFISLLATLSERGYKNNDRK